MSLNLPAKPITEESTHLFSKRVKTNEVKYESFQKTLITYKFNKELEFIVSTSKTGDVNDAGLPTFFVCASLANSDFKVNIHPNSFEVKGRFDSFRVSDINIGNIIIDIYDNLIRMNVDANVQISAEITNRKTTVIDVQEIMSNIKKHIYTEDIEILSYTYDDKTIAYYQADVGWSTTDIQKLKIKNPNGFTVAHKLAMRERLEVLTPEILSLSSNRGITVAHLLAKYAPAKFPEDVPCEILKAEDENGDSVAEILLENSVKSKYFTWLPQNKEVLIEIPKVIPLVIKVLEQLLKRRINDNLFEFIELYETYLEEAKLKKI